MENSQLFTGRTVTNDGKEIEQNSIEKKKEEKNDIEDNDKETENENAENINNVNVAEDIDPDIQHVQLLERKDEDNNEEVEDSNAEDEEEYEDEAEDQDENVDENENTLFDYEFLQQPLYNGSTVSLAEAIIIIETFTARTGLSNRGVQYLLDILHILIGPNCLPETIYKIKKIFSKVLNIISYYTLCPNCNDVVKVQEGVNRIAQIVCTACGHEWKKDINDGYFFAMFDLKTQLKRFLEIPEISKALKNNETYRMSDRSNIEDIYDGELYKNLKKTILKSASNLSFNFFLDGASFFKSGTRSCWPILLSLNELPKELRFKKLLLCGLWFGPKQPLTHALFKPLKQSFNALLEGISWTNFEGQEVISKIVPLCCCADSVARAKLLNNVQFNGEFGCPYCYNPGRYVTLKSKEGETKKKGTWKYPCSGNAQEGDIYQERKENDVRKEMKEGYNLQNKPAVKGEKRKKSYKGFKGPSPMYNVKWFNILWGFPPDWMHCVLLGVVYLMLDMWITGYRLPYYIGSPSKLRKLNSAFSSLKPPSQIHRLSRSVNDRRMWKASEWKSFILYYSIPCLTDVLETKYLKHFALLVEAVGLLLKCNITQQDLQKSEKLLLKFVKKFEKLYGAEKMTFNVHLLLHLTKAVRMCGPLWCFSTFPYESHMCVLKKCVHSAKGVCFQIAERIARYDSLPHLSENIQMTEPVKNTLKIMYLGHPPHVGKETVNNCTLLGRGFSACIFSERENMAVQSAGFENEPLVEFRNVIYNGNKHSTSSYCTNYKRNNSIIQILSDNFAKILRILEVQNKCFFIVEILNTKEKKIGSTTFSHIREVHKTEGRVVKIIEPNEILGSCVYIAIQNKTYYVCTMPSTVEVQ